MAISLPVKPHFVVEHFIIWNLLNYCFRSCKYPFALCNYELFDFICNFSNMSVLSVKKKTVNVIQVFIIKWKIRGAKLENWKISKIYYVFIIFNIWILKKVKNQHHLKQNQTKVCHFNQKFLHSLPLIYINYLIKEIINEDYNFLWVWHFQNVYILLDYNAIKYISYKNILNYANLSS